MRHFRQNRFFWLLLCCTALFNHSSLAKDKAAVIKSQPSEEQTVTELPLLVADQKANICQLTDPEYQQHYNFETRNYKIGICRRGEEWFYYRESKSNPNHVTFILAEVVFGGEVFRAVDGQVTYFVGTNSEGYYSSVMYADNKMIFEPELVANSVNVRQENTTPSNLEDTSNVGYQNLDLSSNYWQVCSEDSNDAHPNLNGWQQFIGKSSNTLQEYATVEGHSFQYLASNVSQAAIETTDGLMVTVDILELTETVNGLCVQPTDSF